MSEQVRSKLKAAMQENARLQAEVERLRASSFVTAVPVEEYEKLKAQVERLKAETERLFYLLNQAYIKNESLRKAGDAMVEIVEGTYCVEKPPALIEWLAAKEGKPSV